MKAGVLWLFAAVCSAGLWFILIKKASQHARPLPVQTLNIIGTVVAVGVVAAFIAARGADDQQAWAWGKHWYWGIAAGVVIGLSNIFTLKAYDSLPLGIVAPAINLACLLPVLYGWAVLRERLTPIQFVGIALAVAAMVLLTYPQTSAPAAPVAAQPDESAAPAP
jgi:drug/metabolite transporter (DMT)-like permease